MLLTKCIVIDDEPLARELLETHIRAAPFLELAGSFENAIAATSFLQTQTVDLIFLDIQMPLLTGVDFMKTVSPLPPVIFTTAYREYAIEGYDLEVIDYLLKPITFERFFKAVSKVQDRPQSQRATEVSAASPDHLFVSINKKQVKVVLDEIRYVESDKDYLNIHLAEKGLVVKITLREFTQQLPDYFMQVHRSYVVNRHFVTAFTQQDVELGELEIPIGGYYKAAVLKALKA